MAKQGKRVLPDEKRRKQIQAVRRRRRMERRAMRTLVLLTTVLLVLIGIKYVRTDSGDKITESMDSQKLQTDLRAASGEGMDEEPLPDVSQAADRCDTGQENIQVIPDTSCRIGSVGDVILHLPVTKAYGGSSPEHPHDFSPALQTFLRAYQSVDYMVVNLETSLAGPDKPYSGFPNFNAPDEIAANLRDAGVDLQLLANNHIYDNGKAGFLRTMEVLRQAGVTYTGARASEQELPYLIADINGIQVGILNYTYEMEHEGERKSINGNIMETSVENNLNSFEPGDIESFYEEVGQMRTELCAKGAEFILMYIHWGNEYELQQNATQEAIAQRLCDIGIDAVIGGHPHVVQPVDVLTGSDGTHKMFCAYSLGNHLSNQRREKISSRPNGHTEDGLMITLTLTRTSGQVSISGIEAVPTYVYKTNQPRYYVIPIYQVEGIEEQTGLQGIQPVIQSSYERTMNVLGTSLEDARRALGIAVEY